MERTIKQVLDGMLERREHSVYEVRSKLGRLGFINASIDAIIEDYVTKGYLSNERYTEEKVLSLMRRGYGPFYVKSVLSQMNLNLNTKDFDWQEAYSVAVRKAGNREGVKLRQYLFRRGFMLGEYNG